MDGFKIVCKLGDVVVGNASAVLGHGSAEPMSVYGLKRPREKREKQNACGAAIYVEDELFAEVDGAALGINFELLAEPVLGEPTDGSY